MATDEAQPILVVEDERDDVEFVRRALAKARVLNPLVVVPTIEAAQAAVNNETTRPVLVFVDLFLSEQQSGLELLEWLRRQSPPVSELPVIVLSVSTDGTHRSRAAALGAVISLQKPITEEVVVHAIEDIGVASRWTKYEGRSGRLLQAR